MASPRRGDRSLTSIRFPEPLASRLAEASEAHGLSKNWLVVKAVEDFLRRLLPPDEVRLTRPRDE